MGIGRRWAAYTVWLTCYFCFSLLLKMFYVYPGSYFHVWALAFWILNLDWALGLLLFLERGLFLSKWVQWAKKQLSSNCRKSDASEFHLYRNKSVNTNTPVAPRWATDPSIKSPESSSPCCMPTLSGIFSSDRSSDPSNCPVSKSVALVPPSLYCFMSSIPMTCCLMCADSIRAGHLL